LQDAEGNTPLHVAILNQHSNITEILLSQPNIDLKMKNNAGQTAFAAALMCKNNNVTRLILKKEPNAAEQVMFYAFNT
jgi:ankyrin repeat protein